MNYSAGGDDNSARRGAGRIDPRLIPSEYPPPELGRASLSESTVGHHTKKFSPQLDKMSSQTKNNSMMGQGADDEDLLDEDEGQPSSCRDFLSHHQISGAAGMAQQNSVDGIFQIQPGLEPQSNESSSNAQLINSQVNSDDEDELTFNSQGKPVPRKAVVGDKKQSRKTIMKPTKPAKPKKEKKPGKVAAAGGDGGGAKSQSKQAAAAASLM